MEGATIFVLILATAFFSVIAYLAVYSRGQEDSPKSHERTPEQDATKSHSNVA